MSQTETQKTPEQEAKELEAKRAARRAKSLSQRTTIRAQHKSVEVKLGAWRGGFARIKRGNNKGSFIEQKTGNLVTVRPKGKRPTPSNQSDE
jgi:hypothetical protein